MKNKLFKESGIGSIAWYLQTFKNNPDRKGFTYIRKEAKGIGQFEDVKIRVEFLVNSRYLDKHSKPDQPKGDRYTVTSFGHRYLSDHAADLENTDLPAPAERESEKTPETEDIQPAVDAAKRLDDETIEEVTERKSTSTVSGALIAAQKRINARNKAISQAENKIVTDHVAKSPSELLGKSFETQDHPVFVLKFTPEKKEPGYAWQKDKKRLPGGKPIETMDNDEIAIDEESPADAPGFLSEEADDIKGSPVDGDKVENCASDDDRPERAMKTTTYLKEIAGRILYDRHATEVTVVDLIEEIEKDVQS